MNHLSIQLRWLMIKRYVECYKIWFCASCNTDLSRRKADWYLTQANYIWERMTESQRTIASNITGRWEHEHCNPKVA